MPDLHAAESESAQTSLAARANNEFATDHYRQLAQESTGDNLFFSPYSLFSALLMTTEGARGETARQMGTVLRFPEVARTTGDPAVLSPWNTTTLHAGMADLKRRLTGGAAADVAQSQETRKRIAQLEQEHETLTQQIEQQQKERRSQPMELVDRARTVADELNQLRQQVDQYELNIANALWGEQTFPFRQAFLGTLLDAYGAAAFPVDFLHDPEGARSRINRWATEQTKERIRNILGEGTITPDTRLVLANAIYFKGNWADQFDKRNTQETDFTQTDGTKGRVRLMAAQGRQWRYAELLPDGTRNEPVLDQQKFEYTLNPNPQGFQLLELPYRGKTLSMIVLLPQQHDGLAALEKQLTADTWNKWLGTMQQQTVHVFLPKFRLETMYPLPGTLSAMGMPAAFQPGGFTGISDVPEARTLALSQVVQKAFVDVNEEGTEAAAVTVITMVFTSARIEPPIPTFRADRPFLFLIRDNQSGAILFLGRVMSPGGSS